MKGIKRKKTQRARKIKITRKREREKRIFSLADFKTKKTSPTVSLLESKNETIMLALVTVLRVNFTHNSLCLILISFKHFSSQTLSCRRERIWPALISNRERYVAKGSKFYLV